MKPKDGKDYPYRRYYEEGSDYHLPPISSPVPRELQGPMYLAADNQWLDLTPTDCPRKSKGDTLGVPVHNWCWKLFEQASMMYGRNVDLQGFMALWNVHGSRFPSLCCLLTEVREIVVATVLSAI